MTTQYTFLMIHQRMCSADLCLMNMSQSDLFKILAKDDSTKMQYTWVESGPGEVPPGSVVAGNTKAGRTLYIAQTGGEAGHYDPTKTCAEELTSACGRPWKILVTTYAGLPYCECLLGMSFIGSVLPDIYSYYLISFLYYYFIVIIS